MTILRVCEHCGVPEDVATLGMHGDSLVCYHCDGDLEAEWVAADPENRRHSLDTFKPYPND